MDEQLELLYFDCRWSFGTLLNFEADTITFRKALKTLPLDGAMMNKDIFSALNRNKSVTLLIVEPLYSTLRHFSDFLLNGVNCRHISQARIVKQGNWRKPKEQGYFKKCKSF
jgi:hypothetical protein